VDPADGLIDADYVEYQVQVTDPTQPLKVALCWTDAPGNPASAVQLVNDLDLQVLHDGADVSRQLPAQLRLVRAAVRDSLNVEELVRLPAPLPAVDGARRSAPRPPGPQRFALCITAASADPRCDRARPLRVRARRHARASR
jgi:hypothetical protein